MIKSSLPTTAPAVLAEKSKLTSEFMPIDEVTTDSESRTVTPSPTGQTTDNPPEYGVMSC